MNISSVFNFTSNVSLTDASPRGIVLIIVESFIFLVLNTTALVGNLLVCAAFYRNPSLRTVTNIFILSLALTDILMAVFAMSLVTSSSIVNSWTTGDIGFEIYGNIANIAGGASLLTVMLLAINRYFRVVRPELYGSIFSKKTSIIMGVTVWVVTIVVITVGLLLAGVRFQTDHLHPASPLAVLPDRKAVISLNVTRGIYIIIPSSVVFICYSKIYLAVR